MILYIMSSDLDFLPKVIKILLKCITFFSYLIKMHRNVKKLRDYNFSLVDFQFIIAFVHIVL